MLPLLYSSSASALFVLSFLCECRNGGSEKQEQNCCADNSTWVHRCFTPVQLICHPAATRSLAGNWRHFSYTLAKIRCQFTTAHTCGQNCSSKLNEEDRNIPGGSKGQKRSGKSAGFQRDSGGFAEFSGYAVPGPTLPGRYPKRAPSHCRRETEEIIEASLSRLFVQEYAEEAAIDRQRAASVVVDKAKLPELIHEMTDARAGGADHLG